MQTSDFTQCSHKLQSSQRSLEQVHRGRHLLPALELLVVAGHAVPARGWRGEETQFSIEAKGTLLNHCRLLLALGKARHSRCRHARVHMRGSSCGTGLACSTAIQSTHWYVCVLRPHSV